MEIWRFLLDKCIKTGMDFAFSGGKLENGDVTVKSTGSRPTGSGGLLSIDIINVELTFRQSALEHICFDNGFFGIGRSEQVFGKLQGTGFTQCQQTAITHLDGDDCARCCLDDLTDIDRIPFQQRAGLSGGRINRVGDAFELGDFADNLCHAECSLTNKLLYSVR